MGTLHTGRAAFYYLFALTVSAVAVISANHILQLGLPFSVHFLIGYVGALLIFVGWHAVLTKGWKRSGLMFLASFIIAFIAEALGVNFGWIFGNYHYTPILGIQVFGVPFLAALAWEPILYAAFCITDILAPNLEGKRLSWLRCIPVYLWLSTVGALATTAWDMMIDPIAVSQGWWVWHDGGAYMPYLANGVPVQNFIGWLGVSFTINLIYRFILNGRQPLQKTRFLGIHGPLTLYASLFLTSAGVSITVLQRNEVALVGAMAMAPFLAIAGSNLSLLRRGWNVMPGSGMTGTTNLRDHT
ncbi:MAG TPA: carotenoid biosynthesis protein [Anaerolineaceae bacterium]